VNRVVGFQWFRAFLAYGRSRISGTRAGRKRNTELLRGAESAGSLQEMTGSRGPDACIDAVGMEASGAGIDHASDRVKQIMHVHTDRGQALRQAILACRKGRTGPIVSGAAPHVTGRRTARVFHVQAQSGWLRASRVYFQLSWRSSGRGGVRLSTLTRGPNRTILIFERQRSELSGSRCSAQTRAAAPHDRTS
jgi:hypothetical protein